MHNPPSKQPSSKDVVESLWGRRDSSWRLFNGERAADLSLDAYFDFYQRQWQYCLQHGASLFQGFDDMRETIQKLNSHATRSDIAADIQQRLKSESTEADGDQTQNSVNFAARTLTMVKLGRLEYEVPRGRELTWESGSLRQFLSDYFGEKHQHGCDGIRLPKSFDAWSLENVGGVEIEFTDNLADHLRLVRDDTVVLVFHHASFLEYQDNRYAHLARPWHPRSYP